MTYISPEYRERLTQLAKELCPKPDNTQGEFDFGAYAEVADVIIERPAAAQLGRTALNRWDDMGNYTVDL